MAALGPPSLTHLVLTIGLEILDSGVTEVRFITPINSLRINWCNRWCAPSWTFLRGTTQGGVIFPGDYAYFLAVARG